MRKGKIERNTKETKISCSLNLDGSGKADISTGIGFFDHMLEQLARHSLIDLEVEANGDIHIDDHHTVEDTGIAFGQALAQAIGDKLGINRYGWCLLPMDDTLIRTALDLSSRPFLYFGIDMPTDKIGSFDTELVREFFQAVSTHGEITLHMEKLHGYNSHHIAEAAFKSFSKSLRVAGDALDRSIMDYMRKKLNLLIGDSTAEKIKKEIGTAIPSTPNTFLMKGRDIRSGTPKEIELTEKDACEAIMPILNQILGGIKEALENTPPELSADLIDMGLVLTGGGALLKNIDKLISQDTGLPVTIADDPLSCVAIGTGRALENEELFSTMLSEY